MPREFSKSVKTALERLVYEAHEKALRPVLADLSSHFERYARGEIDAIQLTDRIQDQQPPIREIYRTFTWSRNSDLPRLVAIGINEGLLDRKAIPTEVLEQVKVWLAVIS